MERISSLSSVESEIALHSAAHKLPPMPLHTSIHFNLPTTSTPSLTILLRSRIGGTRRIIQNDRHQRENLRFNHKIRLDPRFLIKFQLSINASDYRRRRNSLERPDGLLQGDFVKLCCTKEEINGTALKGGTIAFASPGFSELGGSGAGRGYQGSDLSDECVCAVLEGGGIEEVLGLRISVRQISKSDRGWDVEVWREGTTAVGCSQL